jgi:hypothetical protein
MSFLKPLLKTILIASLLFFVLVYLGMKYHWIGFTADDKDKNLELVIPQQSKVLEKNSSSGELLSQDQDGEENFQPQIIQTIKSSTLLSNMTKTQVKEGCLQLLKRTIIDNGTLELAVGDCVLSNYRDPIIETHNEEGVVKSTKSRQAQIRRESVVERCKQQLNSKNHINEVEKQLFFGVCVSK